MRKAGWRAGGEGKLCLRLKTTTNLPLKDKHSSHKDIQRLWNTRCLTLSNSSTGKAWDTRSARSAHFL